MTIINKGNLKENYLPTRHTHRSNRKWYRLTTTHFATQKYHQLSHSELVHLCSNSAAHPAWEEFYRRFDVYIRSYIFKAWKRLTDSENVDNDLMLDLIQDVYLRLLFDDLQPLKSFKGDSDIAFLAYLARISQNVVREYFRRQNAIKRSGKFCSLDLLLDEAYCESKGSRAFTFQYFSHNFEQELFDRLTEREFSDLLTQILSSQKAQRDKFIFEMYALEGLSISEIAELPGLQLKAGSVESIIRRVRARIFQTIQIQLEELQAA